MDTQNTPAPREDGSIPGDAPKPVTVLALLVEVCEDVDGYKWLAFGPDEFYCLDEPLLQAIRAKVPARTQVEVMEVGGDLQPMAVTP